MVNTNDDNNQVDEVEITKEERNEEDIELEEVEEKTGEKLTQLREKLKACEQERRTTMEELQRAKAEFLNAKKRLEEDRKQDKTRITIAHASDLLPLCDSFDMAMSNTEVWEKADKAWRTGIEGIHMQLQKLLQSYGVTKMKAEGEPFDPHRFEAIDTTTVSDEKDVDVVQAVVQAGYELTEGENTVVVRPARVVTGSLDAVK